MYDLIVIGSGPAGYVGAIHAAQSGLKVALIEKDTALGGTCLNRGCIPTKALLFSALQFDKSKKWAEYGLKVSSPAELDYAQVLKRKDGVVKKMNSGVSFLMKKNKVDVFQGTGKLKSTKEVEVTSAQGKKEVLSTQYILLAMGSRVRSLPFAPVDGQFIYSSDEILFTTEVPKTMGIIGGGVIGCEFASCFGRFGSQVTLLEGSDQLIPTEDHETAEELAKGLKKQNVSIHLGVKVTKVEVLKDKKLVAVYVDGQKDPYTFEKLLVSVGRAPVTEEVGLSTVGVKTDERGFIPVDLKSYQTNIPNIYAAGDIIPTPQLAHTGSAEAIFAVDHIAKKPRHPINYLTNPAAIYTYPEVASIGYTEKALKAQNREYKSSKFPFSAIAKAQIEDCPDGFIKILADKKYGEILGVHIVHAKATELIAEFSLGNNLEMTLDELSTTIHPHPTLTETILEAAHGAMGHAIHI
jgi:dihydrolipoamide dehydrogenase